MNELVDYIKDLSVSIPNAILNEAFSVSWHSTNALLHAREKLKEILFQVCDNFQNAIDDKSQFLRICRNVCAIAPTETIEMWNCLFTFGVRHDLQDYKKLGCVTQYISETHPPQHVVFHLLHSKRLPSIRKTTCFLLSKPELALAFLLGGRFSKEATKPLEMVDRLKAILQSYSQYKSLVYSDVLADSWELGNFPRLDSQAFFLLPPKLRCSIIQNERTAEACLSEDLFNSIMERPENYTESHVGKIHYSNTGVSEIN